MFLTNDKQRQKQLVANFFRHQKLTIELSRCKVLRPIIEKIITRCRNGKSNLGLNHINTLRKWAPHRNQLDQIFEISQKYQNRTGGYLRIIRCGYRQGDGAKIGSLRLV